MHVVSEKGRDGGQLVRLFVCQETLPRLLVRGEGGFSFSR